VGRWWSRDPKAEKAQAWTPYRYAFDSPVNVVDPDGRLEDWYMIDENGTFHLVKKTNDPYDIIVKTDRNGNIKYKGQGLFGFLVPKSQRGEPKILLDRIAKGILHDGINFKNQDQIIYVNGPGQPKLNKVEQFLVDMTDYIVHVEIAGAYLSRDRENIEAVYIGKYKNNGLTYSYFTPNYKLLLKNDFTLKDLYVHFHTHPSGVYSTEDQIRPSRKDLEYRDDQRKNFKKFIIITNHPASPIDYTNW